MNKKGLLFFYLMMFCALNSESFAIETKKISISGISSGAFMATQMGIIFSDQVSGVASVAGGTYYCALDHMPVAKEQNRSTIGDASLLLYQPTKDFFDDSYNPLAMFRPSNMGKWFFPSKNNPIYQALACMRNLTNGEDASTYIEQFERDNLIAPASHIKNQKVVIYHGDGDNVIDPKNADHIELLYRQLSVHENDILKIRGQGGHTFPTDKVGLSPCSSEEVPYVSSCGLDLAGKIFEHFFENKLERGTFTKEHLYLVNQPDAPSDLAPYGYLYSGPKCLNDPGSCHLHVAFHGCKMSDSYDEDFQKSYEAQIQMTSLLKVASMKGLFNGGLSLLMIESKVNQMGLLKFAMNSGLAEYAEKNDLMVLFPQTWITEKNFPYNPKGCWDWFGWTGKDYATNRGQETKWLMAFIQNLKKDPRAFIKEEGPDYGAL